MSLNVDLIQKKCKYCGNRREGFSANITHNLTRMAREAGIYKAVWRPEECGITKAKHLIPVLRNAIEEMKTNPDGFKIFDSPNGWGLYENFLPWLERYLAACIRMPKAKVWVSR